MKKKAVIFPCDQELSSLATYIDFENYTITGLVVLENSNALVNNESDIPVIVVTEVDYENFDSIILVDSEIVRHPFIEESIRREKSVIYIEQEKDFDISCLEEIKEDQYITVPIIFVAGVTPYTEKFQVQLALRKKLQENDYKVSLIGSIMVS